MSNNSKVFFKRLQTIYLLYTIGNAIKNVILYCVTYGKKHVGMMIF